MKQICRPRATVPPGCGGSPPNFCPSGNHSRAQMAVFLLATREPGIAPPACVTAPFADVDCAHPFARFIPEVKRRGIWDGCGSGNYCPNAFVTRAQMAVLVTRTFGFAVWPEPRLDRRVQMSFAAGHLTGVTGYGTLSYHRNGMVDQVSHANGVTDTQALDSSGLARPASLGSALAGSTLWSAGPYAYDGAGNVTRIGAEIDIWGREATDAIAAEIEAAIESTWNGHTYTDPKTNLEYSLVVDVKVTNVGPDQRNADAPNRIHITSDLKDGRDFVIEKASSVEEVVETREGDLGFVRIGDSAHFNVKGSGSFAARGRVFR